MTVSPQALSPTEAVEQRIKEVTDETERELEPLERELAAREELKHDRDSYIANLTDRIKHLEREASTLNSGGSNDALAEIMLIDELTTLEKEAASLEAKLQQ